MNALSQERFSCATLLRQEIVKNIRKLSEIINMVNENIKLIVENKKLFELVQEIENYQIKKSPLSPAARGKVISKSGSDYVSDNKEGYGPCKNSLRGCNCSYYICICSSASAKFGK